MSFIAEILRKKICIAKVKIMSKKHTGIFMKIIFLLYLIVYEAKNNK